MSCGQLAGFMLKRVLRSHLQCQVSTRGTHCIAAECRDDHRAGRAGAWKHTFLAKAGRGDRSPVSVAAEAPGWGRGVGVLGGTTCNLLTTVRL